jgi:histidinol-phosphatase (PHP family)
LIPTVKLVDLHVHSTCSADGMSSLADYAHCMASLGLVEVGFCEHADLDPRDRDYGYLDPAHYRREMAAARAMLPGVPLRQGVEITYLAHLEDRLRSWLAAQSWDYVVASVHLVDYADGLALVSESEAVEAYFTTHSQRQAYGPYFEELLRAAHSGLGDVLGHLDVVKRHGAAYYGPFDPAAFEGEIRTVLRAAVDAGTGLEINASGLRERPGEPYPTLTVLRWYRELGGEILTVGSDAHHASNLGAGVREVSRLAQEAGFRAIATFEARQPLWIDLD